MTVINATGLSKRFGSKSVFSDINFTVEAGESVALVGPNGAGKTTLFSIICGYLQPSAGQLSLFGHAPGHSHLVGKLGALPQDAQFDPRLSLSAQLKLFAQLQGYSSSQAQQECLRVLDIVGLSSNLNNKPTELSHGMRKRLAIAQALIGEPQLILLDEPTAGLDPANVIGIRQLIGELNEQATIVISSHNLAELERLCDRVLFLDKGVMRSESCQPTVATTAQITLQLADKLSQENHQLLSHLPGVLSLQQTERNRYRISYDPVLAANMDSVLLTTLTEHNIEYKQMIKGQTLEESLFDHAAQG